MRLIVLLFGPVLLVALCYQLTTPSAENFLEAASIFRSGPVEKEGERTPSQEPLSESCRKTALRLRSRLRGDCRVMVKPPYVLGGDLPEAALEHHYRETIVPTSRALFTCYFDHKPDEPIQILLFSGEKSYRMHARKLDGRRRTSYSGYYQKEERRIVLNIATGNGTLAHELTHALAHFDFPQIPEWFDEGLASLHERSRFFGEGLKLEGVSNWRIFYLLHALRKNRLPSLESLMKSPAIPPGEEAVAYAQSRYLCLYLQERGLLSHYYRKLRSSVEKDPRGAETLCELLNVSSVAEIDQEFREWLRQKAPDLREESRFSG